MESDIEKEFNGVHIYCAQRYTGNALGEESTKFLYSVWGYPSLYIYIG
jgi:hypothetical protein